MKIYAVVVWFNPKPKYVENILTYYDCVDGVIIIDNSTSDNAELLKGLPNVKYLCALENKGIANAMNVGYEIAIKKGGDWVLTMDQDSSFKHQHIDALIKKATEQAINKRIAVFGPNWQGIKSSLSTLDCNSLITSGSLVSLAAYQEISGYNEGLFLDQVDHEFCYRLKRAGYRLLMLTNTHMDHFIGEELIGNFLFFKVSSSNHNHFRKYYMTRNRLYMRKHYSDFGAPYLKMIFMDFLKVALVEKDKFLKFKFMAKGAIDYFRGVKGKLG